MAKNKKPIETAHSLLAAETLRKFTSWDPAQNPPVDELIGWLQFIQNRLVPTLEAIVSRKDLIFKADELKDKELIKTTEYVNLQKQRLTVPLIVDFLNSIDRSADLLETTITGRVTDAFTQGVRIGLLYEKWNSVMDGRYTSNCVPKIARLKAARTTNEKKANRRPDYVTAVKAVMARGIKYRPACEMVAAEHDVSERTVRNHTKELQPKKQPRK